MTRSARTLAASLALTALVAWSPGVAQAGLDDSFDSCDYPKTLDLLVLRPVSLVGLALGTTMYLGLAPFAYATVKKDFGSVTENLIYKPARFAFKRRLGECASLSGS